MMRARAIASLLLLVAGCASSAAHFQTFNTTGIGMALDTDFTTLSSITDVPEPARSAALAIVRARAGEFYTRLQFHHGERRIGTEVLPATPTYLLSFRFSDAAAGIEDYQAEIEVDGEGKVVVPLELPDFSAAPGKMRFATKDQVLAVAHGEHFGSRRMEVALAYSRKFDAIIWSFSQPVNVRADQGELRTLTISAHTAEILDRDTGIYWNH